ncbi:stage V sporulation protein AA [Anaerotignum lactatifermentans]|uniref:Stage V sporulation protein AA n=1 Tax=Anaerotignum lactatifermentans TaxID=160404 RepID=A0ABS2G9T8_9FIRM|nr:stage V sporulation protein AA [Anaerotignum lactatifermentans]MBM6828520.1 stage V sporulation protein AA [Anaerotignum lactatifermentans]MBM6877927.1 stage V sporulation protein AA [Anaerotignum lactatifermentans]MBM6950102.1 stage V sporulation protein AA [Anaerotignum lactatifermentans]
MDIYIKPSQKIQIVRNRLVLLRDVAEVYAGKEIQQKIESLPVFQIQKDEEKRYLLSVLELIQIISSACPEATVSNLGAEDILLEYLPEPKKEHPIFVFGKVLFVCAVLFCGAATTIMCFHSDTQLPLIFRNYYYMFYGENQDLPLILILPYSVGLLAGILLFFNHFSIAAISKDPTPIEVEMTTYENETVNSLIEQLSKEKKKESGK